MYTETPLHHNPSGALAHRNTAGYLAAPPNVEIGSALRGHDAPSSQRSARAARQQIAVGETYDFELAPMPPCAEGLWMELRRGTGELDFQWPVHVKEEG